MRLLSVIIIAKNAEDIIVDAIASVHFADEVIVVDSGSTDRTADLARREKAYVVEQRATDFSEMRNFGLQKARGKWVLYVDADERVTPTLKESILEVVNNKKIVQDTFLVQRKNFYLGKHEWPYVERLERLFKKRSFEGWKGELHESPIVSGPVGQLTGYLYHFTHQDLTSMVKKTNVWSEAEARLRFDAGHPKMTWWRFPRVMLSSFYTSFIEQKGYKAGTVGIIESIYQAFSIFVTYAKLWEMQQKDLKQKE